MVCQRNAPGREPLRAGPWLGHGPAFIHASERDRASIACSVWPNCFSSGVVQSGIATRSTARTLPACSPPSAAKRHRRRRGNSRGGRQSLGGKKGSEGCRRQLGKSRFAPWAVVRGDGRGVREPPPWDSLVSPSESAVCRRASITKNISSLGVDTNSQPMPPAHHRPIAGRGG